MSDPLTASAVALATLVVTKTAEKAAEKMGETLPDGVWGLGVKFVNALRRKDPETAEKIERVAQEPALAESQPADFGDVVLVQQTQLAAQNDPDIQQIAAEIKAVLTSQPQGAIVNLTKLLEKGLVNQGTINNSTFNF